MIASKIYKPAEFHFNYREFAVVDSVQQKCGGGKVKKLSAYFAVQASCLRDQCVLQHVSRKSYISTDVETDANANDFGL